MSGLAALSRKDRERNEIRLRQINAKYPEHLIDVAKELWPPPTEPPFPFRVMRSREFLVQLFLASPTTVRMSVNRTELTTTGRWKENIRWEDLQALKAQAGYAEQDAIEIYPRAADEVNAANMRHLWILSELIPFAWRG